MNAWSYAARKKVTGEGKNEGANAALLSVVDDFALRQRLPELLNLGTGEVGVVSDPKSIQLREPC